MIGLTTKYYDIAGDMVFRNEKLEGIFPEFQRQNTCTLNLDGSLSVDDFGFYSENHDINIKITWVTEEQHGYLFRILKTYSEFLISTFFGFFSAVVRSYQIAGSTATIKLTIKEDLT